MISAKVFEEHYIIEHHPRLNDNSFFYRFQINFLPGEIQKRISVLSIFKKPGSVFYLNGEQEKQVEIICKKLEVEMRSGYLFTEDLQRTFLTELIHFLLKLQQQNTAASLQT